MLGAYGRSGHISNATETESVEERALDWSLAKVVGHTRARKSGQVQGVHERELFNGHYTAPGMVQA